MKGPDTQYLPGTGREVMAITSYDSPKLSDLVHYKFITSDKITAQNSVSLSNNLASCMCDKCVEAISVCARKLSNESLINNSQMLDNYLFEY